MPDMGTKEAFEKCYIPQNIIQKWCREGKINPQPTQDTKNSPWHIEVNATHPKYNKRK